MGSTAGAPTATLLESASHGDSVAVDELLQRYLPGLEAFVRLRHGRMLRAKESASDLVQSVCREILQHLDRYNYRGEAQFRHWLYSTALRKLGDRADYYQAGKRDAGREVALGSEDTSGSGDSALLRHYQTVCTPSRAVAAREEVGRIEAAFARLREEDREVILLSRMVGLSHREIAEELDSTEGAVRTRLSRALARLAGELDSRPGDGS